MTATNSATRNVIDAISRDSRVNDDAAVAAGTLRRLYADHLDELRETIAEMLADESWSQEAEPYNWLREVQQSL